MTYNIAHGRGLLPVQGVSRKRRVESKLLKIARLVKNCSPDILAIQEIDQNSFWSGRMDQVEFLQNACGFPYAIFGINAHRASRLNLNYGNAIFSKHPIIETEHMTFGRKRNLGQKGFVFAEINFHGRHLPIINMHLHYRSRQQRFRQLGIFLQYLNAKFQDEHTSWSIPPVICGDFNTSNRKEDATAALLAYLSKTNHYHLYPQKGHTYPSWLPTRRLDFIFLPSALQKIRSRIVRSYLSDHRPVLIEVGLPESTRKIPHTPPSRLGNNPGKPSTNRKTTGIL